VDDAFYERRTFAAERLDAMADYHRADRLTDLHPHGSVGVGDDPIKFRPFDGPAINIESAGASPKGLDGSPHAKVADGAEIDEANTAGAKGRHLFPGDPPVDDGPVVERHVVSAIRHNGSIIRDAIDVGAVDDEKRRPRSGPLSLAESAHPRRSLWFGVAAP